MSRGNPNGSHCYGLSNGRGKLTDEEAEEIFQAYQRWRHFRYSSLNVPGPSALAARYGISHSQVCNIGRGRRRSTGDTRETKVPRETVSRDNVSA